MHMYTVYKYSIYKGKVWVCLLKDDVRKRLLLPVLVKCRVHSSMSIGTYIKYTVRGKNGSKYSVPEKMQYYINRTYAPS